MLDFPRQSFLMIRHGQTVANKREQTAGMVETPLTDEGRAGAGRARACLELLSPLPCKIVHSSLSRARDTARILNENLNLPMEEEPMIAERDFGVWEGLPWHEVAPRVEAGETPPEGESLAVFTNRLLVGMRRALLANEGLVLFVAHGGVFYSFARAFGRQLEEVENTQLYGFEATDPEAACPFTLVHYRLSEGALVKEQVDLPVRQSL